MAYTGAMNLGDLLRATAARFPKKTALVCNEETLSYEQLDRTTTRLACRLLSEGCHPGDRIAIHGANSIEVAQLFFACFKARLIAVPINVRMKAPEIAYVLAHSNSVLCFSQPELAPLAEEAASKCTSLRGVHTTVGDLSGGETASLPQVEEDCPALILYTSGTTARPKGVTHTHRTLLDTARMVVDVAPESMQVVLVLTQMMHAS